MWRIFVRPHGVHALSLIDDLTAPAIEEMTQSGFEPAVMIETSLNNFQAWLNHGRVLDDEISTQAAKELARRFGGDPSSADWRHFGRLAGFTNQKPGRRLDNGLPPFVKLRECNGRAAEYFFLEVTTLAPKARVEYEAVPPLSRPIKDERIRPLAEFHLDPRYGGDLHRADMAWALYAASGGVSQRDIQNELLNGRDLPKKGGARRQLNYAQRTAGKVIGATRPIQR